MDVEPLEVEIFEAEDGTTPFTEWLEGLNDPLGRAQIDKRLARVRLGLIGEFDAVGDGVIELIFRNKGPGYRIYCGQDGVKLVVLLCGGIKRGQQADIDRAKRFWKYYNS